MKIINLITCLIAITVSCNALSLSTIKLSKDAYSNGEEACRTHQIPTCIPIYNRSQYVLKADYGQGYKSSIVLRNEILLLVDYNQHHEGINMSIQAIKGTDATIFEGYVNDRVGLVCDNQSCRDWR